MQNESDNRRASGAPEPQWGRRHRDSVLVRGGPVQMLAIALAVCAAVIYWFPPEQYALYPRCLLYNLTGLQCPGCGGLRAAHQLLHGHFAAAFELNPIMVLLVPLAGLYGLGRVWRGWAGRDWLWPFRGQVWLWFMLGLILVFTILRNLPAGAWLKL